MEKLHKRNLIIVWCSVVALSLISLMGQFLKCIFDSSRIVLLTIQELSKAQCNNTDNNYTDYSDTDPILSCPLLVS